jgi:hypothetical protein
MLLIERKKEAKVEFVSETKLFQSFERRRKQ